MLKKIVLSAFILQASSLLADVQGICVGTKHQFRLYIVSQKSQNMSQLQLLVRKGSQGKGEVLLKSNLTPNPRKQSEKTAFDYVISNENSGQIGRLRSYFPVSENGVPFIRPVTTIQLKSSRANLSEVISCEFKNQEQSRYKKAQTNKSRKVSCLDVYDNDREILFLPEYGEVHYRQGTHFPSNHDDGLDFSEYDLESNPPVVVMQIIDDEGQKVGGWSYRVGEKYFKAKYQGKMYHRCHIR